MPNYSVAHAKEQLSKLIDEAMRGERVTITRYGKPVVELRPSAQVAPIRKPSAELIDEIAAEAKGRGPLGISAADFVRDLRDEEP